MLTKTYVVGVDGNEAEGGTRGEEGSREQFVGGHALAGKDLEANGSEHGAEHHGGEQVAQGKMFLRSVRVYR